jgi:hypothetical protein
VRLGIRLHGLTTPVLTTVVVSILPPESTAGHVVDPDWRTFGFAAAVAVFGCALLSLVPMQVARRASPLMLLRGQLLQDAPLRASSFRSGLLIGQIVLTGTLLYTTGLVVHSFRHVLAQDVGFEPDDVMVARLPGPSVPPAASQEDRQASVAAFARQTRTVVEWVSRVPGVRSVTTATSWPMGPDGFDETPIRAESDTTGQQVTTLRIGNIRRVSPVDGMPIIRRSAYPPPRTDGLKGLAPPHIDSME